MVQPVVACPAPPSVPAQRMPQHPVRVSFILKNVTKVFYEGDGDAIVGINNMNPRDCFDYLQRRVSNGMATMKVGTGQLQDQVDLNTLMRHPDAVVAFGLQKRLGYRLAVFDIGPPAQQRGPLDG